MSKVQTVKVDRSLFPAECARCAQRPGNEWWNLKGDWGRYMPHSPFFSRGTYYPVCSECQQELIRYRRIQVLLLWGVVVLTGVIWGGINVLTGHRLGFVIGFELGAGIGFVLGLIAVEIFQTSVNSHFAVIKGLRPKLRFRNKTYQVLFDKHWAARKSAAQA